MIIERTKLQWYKGKQYIDLRSYEVARALQKKQPIMALYNNEAMELSLRDLRKKTIIDPEIHDMKYPPYGTYQLFSYEWKPTIKRQIYKVV